MCLPLRSPSSNWVTVDFFDFFCGAETSSCCGVDPLSSDMFFEEMVARYRLGTRCS